MPSNIYDVIGVGIGPFNLGLAALLEPVSEIKALFLEQKPKFQWHPGLLIEGATIQVPFLADLVTMADPSSKFSFLSYLQAKSRLYHFYFWEQFHIPRREYNHYCQWVAAQLPSCCFGQRVEAISWQENLDYFEVKTRDTASGSISTYYCRNLVLGVGSVPRLPECFQNVKAENVFHSAEFLHKRDRCRQSQSITVIGSGQSAAEVFYELLQEQEIYGYRLEWHTRSKGFFPMEYSKLGLEYFSPDYIHYFHSLSPIQREQLLKQQDLLYKGISFKTLAKIYDLLYERSVADHYPNVRLLSSLEVKEVEIGDSYTLAYRHLQQNERFTHKTDCIILATGYHHAIPSCIDGLRSLIEWDNQGRYVVNLDYRLQLSRNIPQQIFVQNGELHTHGVGAPDLGLGAYRNSVIINTLTGRSVYAVNNRNVFQQFGVAA